MENPVAAILLSALSGLSLALIGIAFRIGQSRNIFPLHIATSIGLCGALFFGIQMDWGLLREIPLFIYILALLNAGGQILAMELTKVSLKRGPLSPVWCALNLNFLVVIIYSAIAFHERITFYPMLALLFGILSVVAAANIGNTGSGDGNRKMTVRDKVVYGFILFVILIANSVVFLTIKDLSTRLVPGKTITYLAAYLPNIYFILYLLMAVLCGAVVALQKNKVSRGFDLVKVGLLAGCGSIAGLFLLSLCARYQAALVFTVNGAVTILGGTLASVFFFGEARSRAWYLTIGAAIAAVVLANFAR
ncbi:MAG TPA: hypothetical protein PKM23_11985 [bacterium]|mgnify:CR=1 FL=1|nr:hypothetical protein [bacterium]